MKKRLISLLCAFALLMGMMPAAAFAGSLTYLALGDSITTGYGLDNEDTQNFAALLAEETGFTLQNKAVSGATSEDLKNLIEGNTISSEITNADLITITIGGNDMMNALYEHLAKSWNEAKPDEDPKTAADIQTDLMNGNLSSYLFYFLSFSID